MAEYSFFNPTWEQVRQNYPYAPKTLKKEEREERKLQKAFEKMAKESDAEWNPQMITDRSQLPNRNRWWDIPSQVESPQNKKQFALSWLHDTAESVGNGILGLLGLGDDEDKSEDFDRWFQNYLASGGRGDAGGIGAGLAGTPFPSIGGYAPDWKTLRDAQAGIKAPEYHEQAFNPMNTIANMLMNADWINMDMSKSGKIMQDAFNRRAEDNAKVANATEEAKYNLARDKFNQALQLEKLRAESAQQAAQLAIARWNAMQPKALGGNKMFWRDSQGGLHFEAVDKQGEARTLGTNEALAWLTSLDDKSLKKMSDKDIVNAAKKGSLMLQDKAAQVPWMQGFILQAQEYRNLAKNKEK